MLKYPAAAPRDPRALGEAGHGAQVLIADGNYPLADPIEPARRPARVPQPRAGPG